MSRVVTCAGCGRSADCADPRAAAEWHLSHKCSSPPAPPPDRILAKPS